MSRPRCAHLSFAEVVERPIGTAFQLQYPPAPDGSPNPYSRTEHLRGIVDGRLVLRSWWRSKQRWRYEVRTEHWWEIVARAAHVSTRRPHSASPDTETGAARKRLVAGDDAELAAFARIVKEMSAEVLAKLVGHLDPVTSRYLRTSLGGVQDLPPGAATGGASRSVEGPPHSGPGDGIPADTSHPDGGEALRGSSPSPTGDEP